uniref:SLC3A2_N domain-containing protein n=1 Tax=Ascaris lumbricoides TaxID=6252 RepID=A0A0M3I8U9_ASCLU
MMFNALIWFCLYFASLLFGDELQTTIGTFANEVNATYEMLDLSNTTAEVTATVDDDLLKAISRFLASGVPTNNNSANFTDSTASITFPTEHSSDDDLHTANNNSFILLHTSTVTNLQSDFENHSSDEPPVGMTKTSETLENLTSAKEYNDASALINERPCRWALIKKQSLPAGGKPILRWAIIILAFALGIAIIVAVLVVALDERPNEANNEETIPLKVFIIFYYDIFVVSIISLI